MGQSGAIFGFGFAAFFVFITMRGELPVYWGLLVSTPAGSPAKTGEVQTGANNGAAKYAQLAMELAPLLL